MKNMITVLKAIAEFGCATEKEILCYTDMSKGQFDIEISNLDSLGNIKKLGEKFYITSSGLVWLEHYLKFYKEENAEIIETVNALVEGLLLSQKATYTMRDFESICPNAPKLDEAIRLLMKNQYFTSEITKDAREIAHAIGNKPVTAYHLNMAKFTRT